MVLLTFRGAMVGALLAFCAAGSACGARSALWEGVPRRGADAGAGTRDADARERDASLSAFDAALVGHDAGAALGTDASDRNCERDEDCDDGRACNGREACLPSADDMRRCFGGAPIACDDDDACTHDACTEPTGVCTHEWIDADGDGQRATACGGTDCDEADAATHRGALERCSDLRDNDCDGATDCDDLACASEPVCSRPWSCASYLAYGGDFVDLANVTVPLLSAAPRCDVAPGYGYVVQWTPDSTGDFHVRLRGDVGLALGIFGRCPHGTVRCSPVALDTATTELVVSGRSRETLFFVIGGLREESHAIAALEISPVGERQEVCRNGVDDDGDHAFDCADSDCAGRPECEGCTRREGGVSGCTNALDDDCDGVRDCDDPDCRPFGWECCNGIDDSGEGRVDELACTCDGDASCPPVDGVRGACWDGFQACGARCDLAGGTAFCERVVPSSRCDVTTGDCVLGI